MGEENLRKMKLNGLRSDGTVYVTHYFIIEEHLRKMKSNGLRLYGHEAGGAQCKMNDSGTIDTLVFTAG